MNHPDKNEFMNRVKSGWEEGISVAARCLPQVFNNYKRRGESEGEKPVQCPPSSSFQVNVRKRHFLGLLGGRKGVCRSRRQWRIGLKTQFWWRHRTPAPSARRSHCSTRGDGAFE